MQQKRGYCQSHLRPQDHRVEAVSLADLPHHQLYLTVRSVNSSKGALLPNFFFDICNTKSKNSPKTELMSAFTVFDVPWRRGTLPWHIVIFVGTCMSKSASNSGLGVRLWKGSGEGDASSSIFSLGAPLETVITSVDFSTIVSFDSNQENWYTKRHFEVLFGSRSSRFFA
jgi:hypothetical protein